MIVERQILPVQLGVYGPFEDGRTIEWAEFVTEDGGGIITATRGETCEAWPPALMKQTPASVEFYSGGRERKLKARIVSLGNGKAA
jgi:hypothetical protein